MLTAPTPTPTATATPTATPPRLRHGHRDRHGPVATATATIVVGGTVTPEPTPSQRRHGHRAVRGLHLLAALDRGQVEGRVPASSPAGVKSAAVVLGTRTLCVVTAAPFECDFSPKGTDVGGQALRLIVTDNAGSTTELSRNVVVSRFVAKLKVSVAKKAVKGGIKRTITGKVELPVRRHQDPGLLGQGPADDQARRPLDPQPGGPAVEALHVLPLGHDQAREGQSFSAEVTFGGNTVLNTVGKSRRFS